MAKPIITAGEELKAHQLIQVIDYEAYGVRYYEGDIIAVDGVMVHDALPGDEVYYTLYPVSFLVFDK